MLSSTWLQEAQPAQHAASSHPQNVEAGGWTLKLSHFPEQFPLEHVQLYAAAVAAATGLAAQIWVGHALKKPCRPVAGIRFQRHVVLHQHLPQHKAVPVMGQEVTTLPWNGPRAPSPVLATAAGAHILHSNVCMTKKYCLQKVSALTKPWVCTKPDVSAWPRVACMCNMQWHCHQGQLLCSFGCCNSLQGALAQMQSVQCFWQHLATV